MAQINLYRGSFYDKLITSDSRVTAPGLCPGEESPGFTGDGAG